MLQQRAAAAPSGWHSGTPIPHQKVIMSRKHILTEDLSFAGVDERPDVQGLYERALEPLGRIERSRLTGPLPAEFDAVVAEADDAVREHRRAYDAEAQPQRDRARSLRIAERVRKAVVVLTVLLGIVVLFRSFGTGLVLLLLVIVGNIVARRMISGRAARLAAESQQRALRVIERLGDIPFPGEPTGGAAARADVLFLKTLSEIERMTEMQRRQSEQMMRLQTQQHQEQMSAMNRSMEAQKLALAESRFHSDLAVGPRGFFGSMRTARIRAQQDQRLG